MFSKCIPFYTELNFEGKRKYRLEDYARVYLIIIY